MNQPRFEGSYLGASDRISAAAIMECKVCWTPYDPAQGDDTRQILPGTPFLALPEDWSCPNCSAPRDQFMVREDPGAMSAQAAEDIARRTAALVSDFTDVWHAKMRGLPMVNTALHVEAVGFQLHEGRPLGVLVAPWFMNLILLPAEGEDWSTLTPGLHEEITFPSGTYEFIHNVRPMVGGYKACSLFSPMGDFASQMQAVEVARAVMVGLFDAANRAETDRAADIRIAREADLAALAEAEAAAEAEAEAEAARAEAAQRPTRRALISGGLATGAQAGAAPADDSPAADA